MLGHGGWHAFELQLTTVPIIMIASKTPAIVLITSTPFVYLSKK